MVSGREKFSKNIESLNFYIVKTFERAFTSTPKRESVDLLKSIAGYLGNDTLGELLGRISWHNKFGDFLFDGRNMNCDKDNYDQYFADAVNNISLDDISSFDEVILRINLQLTNDLLHGYVQFEHIQPILKRIESTVSSLRKVIDISVAQSESINQENTPILTVISLRKCNQEIKKVLPLLIAKHYYHQHKDTVGYPPNKTTHLIVDEAHNILSKQSMREVENWKDYRLELFEEIIKEGRKFGFYLTLASQRPADISPTIMSQIHNFFIHRLVNDRDLMLIDNTISTLDNMSKQMIPHLSKGCCVITGVSFDLPIIIQVDLLDSERQPDSEDVDLNILWGES